MLSAEDAAKIAQDYKEPSSLSEETKLKISELIKEASLKGKRELKIEVEQSYWSFFTDHPPKYFIESQEIKGEIIEIKNFLVSNGYIFNTSGDSDPTEYIFKW